VSASLHDTIFATGALILFLAILPAVVRKVVMPLSTICISGGVIFVFALNYASMHYVYATVVEALNVISWVYLLRIALRERNSRPCA
jgi:hypothetical protein